MMSKMTDLALRVSTLLTHGQRPRSFRQLVRDLRTEDQGSGTTETVIMVAVIVVIAIGVGALLSSKIMDKAMSIQF